uniref:C-type lectin-like n=1 Tax=Pelodiscus sinensis TaxID=13735 RepID=K7GDS9_PELSI
SGRKASGCRHGWMHYGDHCFRFFPQKVTWSAAEVQCQHHHPSAHLASILSERERDVVAHYLSMSTSYARVWIGLHNPNKDRTWVWTDGSLFRYDSWNPGEPNNRGGREFCVEVWAHTGKQSLKHTCSSKGAPSGPCVH